MHYKSKDGLSALLKKHKLDEKDYEKIKEILKREPNLVELGIFSALWSEHCSYKSSKIYLKELPTQAPWVVQGPGENAGVISLGANSKGENLVAIFKIESHNHPSFIEPEAGAATGVGGILRDIFTMGANPIANLNVLRFGDILDSKVKKKHKQLLCGVAQGIGGYGNCMGIPTIGGETAFEACYNGNILVNAFSLGITKQESVFYGKASGVGNPVIYVGSKTGRDGLGGAVMSSDGFGEQSKALRPTVQIGDPFIERLLLEACLEVFSKDLIVGIQDMGAAGLTSSSFEMASRSGSGMILWLDKVPTRESNMTPYELLLSESQERMLLCAKKGKEGEIKEIFEKYDLDCEIVGEVKDGGVMELYWEDSICASLPIAPLVESAPILRREVRKPSYLEKTKALQLHLHAKSLPLNNQALQAYLESQSEIIDLKTHRPKGNLTTLIFKEMLASLEINDKAWIYEQYDQTIKGSTIKGSGLGDASIVSLKNFDSPKAIALSANCDSRYCFLNPKEGAKIAVAKAGRKVALSGARPLAITDCLNFGNPENPEVMWQFKESCEGLKQACEILETPIVSGNVSLYNQSEKEGDIHPTPVVVMVGLLDDYSLAIGSHFVKEDSLICIVGGGVSALLDSGDLGARELNMAGSLLQKLLGSELSGELESLDLEIELSLWRFLQECTQIKLLLSAKSIGQGGIAMALARMAVISNKGIEALPTIDELRGLDFMRFEKLHDQKVLHEIQMDLERLSSANPLALFAEPHSQVICEISPHNLSIIKRLAKIKGLECYCLGRVSTSREIKIGSIKLDLDEARRLYCTSFEDRIFA